MFKIRHLLPAALLLATTALTGCGSGGAAAENGVTTLKYQGSVGTVTPAELAEDLGYLPGIKLEWVGNTISGPQDIQSVATGQIDFGGAFNGAIVKLVEAKSPIKAVVSYYGSDKDTAIGFWTLDGSPIKGPRDLIGKKIGVNTLGAHLEAVIKEYLQRGGLTKDEIGQVELVVVPPVNTEQSLRAKQIDVGALSGILRDKALERGGITELFNDVTLLGEFNAGSLVVRDDLVKKNPEAVKTFVTGVGKALDWARETPREEVIAKFNEIVEKRGRNEDSSALQYFKGYGVSSPGGRIADTEFQTWIDWLTREGEIKSALKPADVFTNEFNAGSS
ncbi:ABC transporter substrate-binding protein [Actinocorallia sp. A-T 12471]|uniref:ABC transporter substrate-binding protein n=1 Tax=Actinocorallia sp. A-T 12471 TaxID=3089813 RepID=UPI0029D03CDE|nr:ABC transporter substrate-binding protein [Actinocorallia sp. A-T 12471]MDX6743567.1 ABC transporter substrate-binding protein [Actinocorallia sp. A-T 12471]